jgi:hypothetical protein
LRKRVTSPEPSPNDRPTVTHGPPGRRRIILVAVVPPVTPSLSQHLQTQNPGLRLRGSPDTPKQVSCPLQADSRQRAYILFQTAAPFGPAVSCPVDGRACPPAPDKVSWFLIRRRFLPSRTGRLCPPPFPPMHCTAPILVPFKLFPTYFRLSRVLLP